MDLPIEKKISGLVAQQFPSFYQEEGPVFIEFVKAYYAWMEEENNTLYMGRRAAEFQDIDTTLESFLEHFQKKYLYGVPFNVIINKRYLLKHVLDVYRSKGSILCYKLLFRLIYNQDVEVYLPGIDMLRVSDGTWKQPKYLEVSDPDGTAKDLVGTTILGSASMTTAVVESYISEPVNSNIITTLFISNLNPRGGEFTQGEKIIAYDDRNSEDLADIIATSPSVLGSLNSIDILNGGQDFSVGDVLAIAHKDGSGNVISFGINGKVKVATTARGEGQLSFTITRPGFGITENANTYLFNHATDTTGSGASFEVGLLSFTEEVEYNTDLICDYANLLLNAVSFGFPGAPSANATTNVGLMLTFVTDTFGSLATLGNVRTGSEYTQVPYTFVRDVIPSKNLIGNVAFTTANTLVTGTSTTFTQYFVANDCILLMPNSTVTEYHIVKEVTNNTILHTYGVPAQNSAAGAKHKLAPAILPANFAPYQNVMYSADGSINGLNANVYAVPGQGDSIVGTVKAVDSGKGYIDDELVYLYLSDSLDNPTIIAGGTGYTNNSPLLFIGGEPAKEATGYVTTNANGTVTAAVTDYAGCGYRSVPEVRVKTTLGTGARLETEVVAMSQASEVIGRVVKTGVGVQRGFHTTTRGFLSSDKYIQDSYFYQDFSYQLKVATTLDKYRSILYDTFHIAGTEMFGKYDVKTTVSSPISVLYSNASPTIT